jgi:hypothetical protein
MNEYTFDFYKEAEFVATKTFYVEKLETAYLRAAKFLRKNKREIDDYEYLSPLKHTGTQKSPFGIGS